MTENNSNANNFENNSYKAVLLMITSTYSTLTWGHSEPGTNGLTKTIDD
jgi:hypothetical protein